jgi:hypothetical protein
LLDMPLPLFPTRRAAAADTARRKEFASLNRRRVRINVQVSHANANGHRFGLILRPFILFFPASVSVSEL